MMVILNPNPSLNIISTTMNFAVGGATSAMTCQRIYKKKLGLKDGRYRCQIQQPELYKLVHELTDRFFIEERLQESHHMFDSQEN